MSEFRLRFKPNWIPSLNPQWQDLTSRVLFDAIPSISAGIQRREDPFIVTYSDLSLVCSNYDHRLDPLFDLDNAQGTDLANLRAPLIHLGKVVFAEREFGQPNWRILFMGYVDPRAVQRDEKDGVIRFTAFSPAKLLEFGNAERVHRFSAICEPQPCVLFGYDLLHPATPPGGTSPDNSWWQLNGASALQFFQGDKFNAVTKVLPANYSEGMELTDLAGTELIVRQTSISGGNLLIKATDEQGEPVEDISLVAGDANMQIITPWYHGKTSSELIQLLVDEANAALAEAGYDDVITLVQEPVTATLPQSAIDSINGIGVTPPQTGIGWFSDAAVRAFATGSGDTGNKKPDILQDPYSFDRTFPLWPFQNTVSPVFGRVFPAPEYNQPLTYPNKTPQHRSAVKDLANAPRIPQSLHHVFTDPSLSGASGGKRSVDFQLTPSSFDGAATKNLYRLDCYDYCVVRSFHNPDLDPLWRIKYGMTLQQWQTVDGGITWTQVGATATSPGGVENIDLSYAPPRPSVESAAALNIYKVGASSWLFIIKDAGRGKAFYYLSATETPTAATIFAGMTEFVNLSGFRSGAVFDGTTVFFFSDRGGYERLTSGTSFSMASGSAIITGSSTQFLTQFIVGDEVRFPEFGLTFKILSITSNTLMTATAVNPGPAIATAVAYAKTPQTGVSVFYWNGSAMVPGTLSGFPVLVGSDFIGAVYDDTARSRLYMVQGNSNLLGLDYNFSAPTATVTAQKSIFLDSINYLMGDDNAAFTGGIPANTRPIKSAWITGPVDVLQGPPGQQTDYPSALDAMIVGTIQKNYILSDRFGGVTEVADFTDLSVSTAIALLAQIPQQVTFSGPAQILVPDIDAWSPLPVVSIKGRVRVGAPTADLTLYAVVANFEPWMIQYGSIWVGNSSSDEADPDKAIVKQVRNDKSFTVNGVTYTVAAARYGGAKALTINNQFIFTKSVAKVMANGFAYEFLIPRPSGKITVLDPFAVSGTLNIEPLMIVRYLGRGVDHYAPPLVFEGRVLRVDYSLQDDNLKLEIA